MLGLSIFEYWHNERKQWRVLNNTNRRQFLHNYFKTNIDQNFKLHSFD